MTKTELRRLRLLRGDTRRSDDEEAEYRILCRLAELEVEGEELRLIELKALAFGLKVPTIKANNDEGDLDDWDGVER